MPILGNHQLKRAMQLVSGGLLLFLTPVLGLFVLPQAANAQTSHVLDSESKLWVEGTSTRNDWTVHAGTVEGSATLDEAGSGASLSAIRVSVPARQVVSNSSTIMDRLMHDALKATEHPGITYELVEATPVETEEGGFALQTTGRLTLAGITNTIEMLVSGEDVGDGRFRYTGSTPLKMTEYGMTPPTAMFGALRTGDDVTVHFDIVAAPSE